MVQIISPKTLMQIDWGKYKKNVANVEKKDMTDIDHVTDILTF